LLLLVAAIYVKIVKYLSKLRDQHKCNFFVFRNSWHLWHKKWAVCWTLHNKLMCLHIKMFTLEMFAQISFKNNGWFFSDCIHFCNKLHILVLIHYYQWNILYDSCLRTISWCVSWQEWTQSLEKNEIFAQFFDKFKTRLHQFFLLEVAAVSFDSKTGPAKLFIVVIMP